jgi:hypothetical protein
MKSASRLERLEADTHTAVSSFVQQQFCTKLFRFMSLGAAVDRAYAATSRRIHETQNSRRPSSLEAAWLAQARIQ